MTEQATAVIAPVATGRPHRVKRWFYIGAGLFMILVSVAGFGSSIIDQSARKAPPTPLVIAHGVVASAWLLLFLAQATLVATSRVDVHRRLGRVGPGLAVVMSALVFLTTVEMGRRGYDLSFDATRAFPPPPGGSAAEIAADILSPLLGFLAFIVLVTAGLWYRHRPDIHKRLMLFAVLGLHGVPLTHLTGYLLGHWPAQAGLFSLIGRAIEILLLSASGVYDKVSQGRIHPVSLWVPILTFAWEFVLGSVMMPSVAWREFATWLIR
jgi:hypothetical protein